MKTSVSVWLAAALVLLLGGSSGTAAQSVAPLATCNPPDCNDGNACTIDTCDPDLVECVHTPCDCTDNNACTADSCDPALGCQHPPVPDGQACDDHSAQTCNDHCQAGVCVAGFSCDDGNVCTVDTCAPGGGCQHSPVPDGQFCDDHSDQTCFDHCEAGSCVSHQSCQCPTNCDDGNPCTDDGCDLQGVCTHTVRSCDDKNDCTYDYCWPDTGECRHDTDQRRDWPCEIGRTCEVGKCLDGGCYGIYPRGCNDNSDCTSDSCNPASGCVYVPVTKDSDADAHLDAACGGDDCNDNDPDAWHPVSEVANVQAANPSPTTITWDGQAASAGPGTTYEVAFGVMMSPGAGYGSAACLSTGGASTSYQDGRPLVVGQVNWYLVRARNSCGTGDYGQGSNGVPRSIAACP
jgi:hypothetical protein